MKAKSLPSQEYVKTLLEYDLNTGMFRWRPRKSVQFTGRHAGKEAGMVNHDGYRQIAFNKKWWMAHRLAWLYVHGQDPGEKELDHINGNRADNRIENLRLSDRDQNCQNTKRKTVHGGSKVKAASRGVYQLPSGRFWAKIGARKTGEYLGSFDTLSEAKAARDAASLKKHGDFARID